MKTECNLNWHQVCLALGVHFNPLIQEIEVRDSFIAEIHTKLATNMYQTEVLKLALESLINRVEASTIDASHVRLCKSILASYGGALKN